MLSFGNFWKGNYARARPEGTETMDEEKTAFSVGKLGNYLRCSLGKDFFLLDFFLVKKGLRMAQRPRPPTSVCISVGRPKACFKIIFLLLSLLYE